MTTKTRKAKAKRPPVDVRERVTQRVLQLLDEGTVPWREPWTASAGAQGRHRSMATGKAYRGINQLLLTFTKWESPWWLTFNHMVEHGGTLRFEAKEDRTQELVTFWRRISVKDEKRIERDPDARKTIWLIKHSHVFNLDQVQGIDPPAPAEQVPPIEAAEALANTYVQAGGVGHAYGLPAYSAPVDTVFMPPLNEFKTPDGYYAAWFHELAHSTGHRDRLDRPGIAEFDTWASVQYADEELVAEMAAAMLSAIAGLNVASLEQNSAAYIDHWRQKISADKGLVIAAASRAHKAVDLILGENQQDEEETA